MSTDLVVIEKQLMAYRPKFEELLPATLPAERLIRTVMVSLEQNPTLANCNPNSIIRSAMSAAVLGLEVDGVSGQGYIVPFKGQAQFLCGYKGMVTLAARAGRTLEGHVVYAGDTFSYDEGQDTIQHRWSLESDRERVVGAYAKSRGKGYPTLIKVLTLPAILAIKAKSAGAGRSSSPWNTDFAAMARKSAMRALSSELPVLALHQAVQLDTQHELGHVATLDPERGGVVVEGELLEEEKPAREELPGVAKLRITWPGGEQSEPYDLATWVKVFLRAVERGTPEQVSTLMSENKSVIETLPNQEHAAIMEAVQ